LHLILGIMFPTPFKEIAVHPVEAEGIRPETIHRGGIIIPVIPFFIDPMDFSAAAPG